MVVVVVEVGFLSALCVSAASECTNAFEIEHDEKWQRKVACDDVDAVKVLVSLR